MCGGVLAAVTGCSTTKSRSVEAQGMYVSETGQLAVGKVQVDAVPENVDSAIIHYSEDTALLSPSTKTHKIDIVLTGTNSTANASDITTAICNAFVSVAPALASAEASAPKGKTTLDTVEHNRTATQTERLAKAAPATTGTDGPSVPQCTDCTAATSTDCPDGNCIETQR